MHKIEEGAQGDGEPGALEEVMISDTHFLSTPVFLQDLGNPPCLLRESKAWRG